MTRVTFLDADADASGERGWHILDVTRTRTACGMVMSFRAARDDGTLVWVRCAMCRAALGDLLQDGQLVDHGGVTHRARPITWMNLESTSITRAWTTWESACEEQESDQGDATSLVDCLECLARRTAS